MVKRKFKIYITIVLITIQIFVVIKRTDVYGNTSYSQKFIDLCEGEEWFIEEVEKLLIQQGLSIDKLQSKDDLNNIYSLGIYNKDIQGKIPKAMGEFQNLENIYFAENQLEGEIPKEIYSLKNLKNLDLSSNSISGQIEDEISNLENLNTLLLSYNDLIGTIPNEIGTLEKIQNLDLSANNLTGEIPEELGNLENILYMSLSNNELSGEIPEELSNLTNIEFLLLWDNNLEGNIPSSLGELQNLIILDLADNLLTGEVPQSLLDKNIEISLENNNFGENLDNGEDGDDNLNSGYGEDKNDNKEEENIVIEEVVVEDRIKLRNDIKYIQGYSDNTVRPDALITREEFSTIMYRLIDEKEISWENEVDDFIDVEEERWSYEAIKYLQMENILSGYQGVFRPEDNLTRAEFAKIISITLSLTETVDNDFIDIKVHWAEEYINRVVTAGFMIGYGDNEFRPESFITRAEVITAMNRILGKDNLNVEYLENNFIDLDEEHWAYESILIATN